MLKTKIMALALACTLPAALAAQQLEQRGTAGGWDVMIDPSLGNGCLIQAGYDDGSVVRIGFDHVEGAGYVTAIEPGGTLAGLEGAIRCQDEIG